MSFTRRDVNHPRLREEICIESDVSFYNFNNASSNETKILEKPLPDEVCSAERASEMGFLLSSQSKH